MADACLTVAYYETDILGNTLEMCIMFDGLTYDQWIVRDSDLNIFITALTMNDVYVTELSKRLSAAQAN